MIKTYVCSYDLRVTMSKLSDWPRFCEEIQTVGKYPQDLRGVQNAEAARQKVSAALMGRVPVQW